MPCALVSLPTQHSDQDNVTQSQSQPKFLPPGGLLSSINSNGAEVIQHPASALPVFPILASSRVDITQERYAFMGNMTIYKMTELSVCAG